MFDIHATACMRLMPCLGAAKNWRLGKRDLQAQKVLTTSNQRIFFYVLSCATPHNELQSQFARRSAVDRRACACR
jgi:hypothetical protein